MRLDSSEITSQAEARRLTNSHTVPPDFDIAEEAAHLSHLINDQSQMQDRLQDYEQPRFEGAGGSGIVLSAIYTPFETRRAIKFPRKRLFAEPSGVSDLPDVDPELHALSKVSHPNITRLYDSFRLIGGNGLCVITEYIADAEPLDAFAIRLCNTEECRESKSYLNRALHEVAITVYHIVDALRYMHDDARLFHFDLKPDNILIGDNGTSYVTDMGFARDMDRYKNGDVVEVGFTWKYAHPDLTDPHRGARVTRTAAKSKNSLSAEQLGPRFDIFAFGRTIQETLQGLRKEYADYIESDYIYNFLHIVACLCLDARNAAGQVDRGDFVSDEALGIPARVFADHKLASFEGVQISLDRLLGRRRLEDDLPEVDRWFAETISCTDAGVTTFTHRVAATVAHPAVKRLKGEMQLGMLREVFPTATHSRFEHSLGTYHAAREYLEALYYDPENPVFRALFDVGKATALLVASLIHDVGATSYGHELEEIDEEEFDHTDLIDVIVRSPSFRDAKGRTLLDIIEGHEPDCWALQYTDVCNIISGRVTHPWDFVLHDIVNGQLDADKLDYLNRDSQECRVPYGSGIDRQRFLRSLTTSPLVEGQRAVLRLAVKQKGAASAEAFAFARYQLYQSLYWHHTFRSGKAMFFEAVHRMYADLRKDFRGGDLLDKHPLRRAYLRYVFGIEDSELQATAPRARRGSKAAKKTSVVSEIARRSEIDETPPEEETWDRTMEFFWKLSSGTARLLIEDLMNRKYYKRIMEWSVGDLSHPNWVRLRDKFTKNRAEVQKSVEEALVKALRTSIQSQIKARESLVEDRVLERFEGIVRERAIILLDLPLRGWFSSGAGPIFVSDFKRRYFRTSVGRTEQGGKTLWSEQLPDMMPRIAHFRLFCEPDVHSMLVRVMSMDHVRDAVVEALPELGSL